MKTLTMVLLLCACTFSYAQTAEEYFKMSEEQYKKDNVRSALKYIESAVALDSTNLEYLKSWAYILDELDDHENALMVADHSLSIDPKQPHLLNLTGFIKQRKLDIAGALRDYEAAMKYADNDTIYLSLLNNRASARMQIRDFEGAYEDLILIYEMDSTSMATLINLGAVCGDVGKPDDAIYYLEKAVALEPDNNWGYVNIGFQLQDMGDYEKSIGYFDKALELDPNDALSYNNRSYSKLKIGDTKGAMKDVERSIKLYPSNSYAYRNRGLIYLKMKDRENACKDFHIATELKFKTMYGDEVEDLMKQYCYK